MQHNVVTESVCAGAVDAYKIGQCLAMARMQMQLLHCWYTWKGSLLVVHVQKNSRMQLCMSNSPDQDDDDAHQHKP